MAENASQDALAAISRHMAQLSTEVDYLRRTLGMVENVLPYPKAKRGGCAKARKWINEALLRDRSKLEI